MRFVIERCCRKVSLREVLKDAIKIVIKRSLFKKVKEPCYGKSAAAGLYQTCFRK